jgi:hypothetical protein
MLSSARNAKNISLSEKIFHFIENNFSDDENHLSSARMLLANAYGLSGNKEMSSNLRTKLNQSKMRRKIGCTSTIVNNKVYASYH